MIVGRSTDVKLKEDSGFFGDLTGLPVASGVFNHEAYAVRCESCGTVVFPGEIGEGG